MDDNELDPEITEAVAEARANFSLADRVKGRGQRTRSITVYTDEIAGEQHLEVLAKIVALDDRLGKLAVFHDAAVETEEPELVAAIEALMDKATEESKDKGAIEALQAQSDVLKAEINRTSLTFNLRAVPEIIIKDARRRARVHCGIRGKGITEEQAEQFADVAASFVLAKMVVGYVDHETGAERGAVTDEEAILLGDMLPKPEYQRILAKAEEIQQRNAFDQTITEQADFSQAI